MAIAQVEVKGIEVVDKPITFTSSFDFKTHSPVTLESKHEQGLWEGSSVSYFSPYYPHQRVSLNDYSVTSCDETEVFSRNLLMDTKWKVFWIQIFDCKNKELSFYGPFKIDLPVKSVYDLKDYDDFERQIDKK